MSDREVTIQDFMLPEFRFKDPKDYEFRADGSIARKDRWEKGIRSIASNICGGGRYSYEIDNLVDVVE